MTPGLLLAVILGAPSWTSLARPVPELVGRTIRSLAASSRYLFVGSDRGLERFDLETHELKLLDREAPGKGIAVDEVGRQVYCFDHGGGQGATYVIDFEGHRLPVADVFSWEVDARWARGLRLVGSEVTAAAWDSNGEFYCPWKGRCLLRASARDRLRRTGEASSGPSYSAAVSPRTFFYGGLLGLVSLRRVDRRSTFWPTKSEESQSATSMVVARETLFLGVWNAVPVNGVYSIPLAVFEKDQRSRSRSTPVSRPEVPPPARGTAE